jgi:hypothetical protein
MKVSSFSLQICGDKTSAGGLEGLSQERAALQLVKLLDNEPVGTSDKNGAAWSI